MRINIRLPSEQELVSIVNTTSVLLLGGNQEGQTKLFMQPQLGSEQENLIKVQPVSHLVLRQDRHNKLVRQLLLVIVQVLIIKAHLL